MVKSRVVADIVQGWMVRKRDGRSVPFDTEKIKAAIQRCFRQMETEHGWEAGYQDGKLDSLVRAVVHILVAEKNTTPDVETIQRLVIQQLWVEGLFDAAEHYQNYREERRKLRTLRPIPPEVVERVLTDQKHFPTDLQYYQFMGKFARWREQDRRRETWRETVYERVIPWFQKLPQVKGKLTPAEWDELSTAMYQLEASPAMRVVQMAGPALDRCNFGVFNCCAAPLEDLFAFSELLYILMQGTGMGFSVENDYIGELPRIKKQKGKKAETLVVQDSTEGWCQTYFEALQRWWEGYDVQFDTSLVRPAGARLRTKGGRASGPGPYLELMAFARNMVFARQGKYLEDTDAHRLACFTGRIVQVGGVRRAATISLSDLNSPGMRGIKSGNWYEDKTYWRDGKYLTMANNSAVFEERPSIEQFMEEWWALVRSKSGERGIFNREAIIRNKPARRKKARFLTNPCAEVVLRPYGLCNLSLAIARPDDTVETLKRKVRVATIFGILQSTCTKFNYVRDDYRRNAEEERLLGVDITGHADCPLLRPDAPGRAELLQLLKGVVDQTKAEFSPRLGINPSAADTCVKPGGDSSVFFNCASGVSPWFSDYQIRWVREPKDTPVARFLLESGVPHAPAPEAPERLLVFGFPRSAPMGATTRNDLTAIQQMENWLEWKKHWAEHSVSATIYVEEDEWLDVGAWVYKREHWDHISGLSFLPKDNGVYKYAPNEELTEAEYQEFLSRFPVLNWAKLQQYEEEDETESAQTYACVGGACEL